MNKIFNRENAVALAIVFVGVILATVFGGAIVDALRKAKAKVTGAA